MQKSLSFIFGMLISVAISFGLILLFALIVQALTLNDTVVRIINQVIKIVAIFFGAKFCIKNRGALQGGIFGLAFGVITLIIFSIISSSISFDFSVILEILYCVFVGAVCGIISAQFNDN